MVNYTLFYCDPEAADICSGHGSCLASHSTFENFDVVQSYKCVCEEGWTGTSFFINYHGFDCHIPVPVIRLLWGLVIFGTLRVGVYIFNCIVHDKKKKSSRSSSSAGMSPGTSSSGKDKKKKPKTSWKSKWTYVKTYFKGYSKMRRKQVLRMMYYEGFVIPLRLFLAILFIGFSDFSLGYSLLPTIVFAMISVLEHHLRISGREEQIGILVSVGDFTLKTQQEVVKSVKSAGHFSMLLRVIELSLVLSMVLVVTDTPHDVLMIYREQGDNEFIVDPTVLGTGGLLLTIYYCVMILQFILLSRIGLLLKKISRDLADTMRKNEQVIHGIVNQPKVSVSRKSRTQISHLHSTKSKNMDPLLALPVKEELSEAGEQQPELPTPSLHKKPSIRKMETSDKFSSVNSSYQENTTRSNDLSLHSEGYVESFHVKHLRMLQANATNMVYQNIILAIVALVLCFPSFEQYQTYGFIAMNLISIFGDGQLPFSWQASTNRTLKMFCFCKDHMNTKVKPAGVKQNSFLLRKKNTMTKSGFFHRNFSTGRHLTATFHRSSLGRSGNKISIADGNRSSHHIIVNQNEQLND